CRGRVAGTHALRVCLGNMAAGRHIVNKPYVAAYGAAAPQRDTTQYGCTRVYDHVVFNDGVAGQAFFDLAVGVGGKALGPQRDRLINTHALADDGGFADNDAGAMVDEEAGADLCPRMDVDTRLRVRQFGRHARPQMRGLVVELMGDAVME